jgi:iron complex transport system ATP-binding protein
MSYLEIEKLNVALGNAHILKDIQVNLEKGDFIGVIGPNGSGKSTLLKTIYRTLAPVNGCIFFDGKRLDTYSHKASAQKMSVVSQHNDHAFEFTVKELVMMGRAPYKGFLDKDTKEDAEVVMDALDKVSMTDYGDRLYSTLSGGEKQRVILARALAQQSELMILDEPTNHLDIRHQFELMNVVKDLDLTVIFAVHDLNVALLYCNKICILNEGHLVEVGDPKSLITPEMIWEIYGVSAQVVTLEDGRLHIIYNNV